MESEMRLGGSEHRTPGEATIWNARTGEAMVVLKGFIGSVNSVAFGPNGDLYVTSQGDDTVKRYNGASGSYVEDFVITASGGLNAPFDLEFASASSPQVVPSLSQVGYHIVVLIMLGIGARSRGGLQGGSRSNGDHA